ncbi:hypothetical protein N9L55_03060 [Alphaproteobacteria bacterium]|nr:hypothetical protein [Alphaproteobacteria bacterium]
MKIRYNSTPKRDGLYSECLDVQLDAVKELNLIPAGDYLHLQIVSLSLSHSLSAGSYRDKISATDKFKKSLVGRLSPVSNEDFRHRVKVLGETDWKSQFNVHFTIANAKEIGCSFHWFEERDYYPGDFFLEVGLSKNQFDQLQNLLDDQNSYLGEVIIHTKGFRGVFQEWHPGLYDVDNDFDFYLLPQNSLVENETDLPLTFNAISYIDGLHKDFRIHMENQKQFDVPLTQQEIWDKEESDEEERRVAHNSLFSNRVKNLIISAAVYSFLALFALIFWGVILSALFFLFGGDFFSWALRLFN